MKRVGVIGASGYTGLELMRIIFSHQKLEVSMLTARKYVTERVSKLYPSLTGFFDFDFKEYKSELIAESCDAVFLALPHGESMKVAKELLDYGIKIVDLSADFRFHDANEYEKFYGMKHVCPEIAESAVYGLTEIMRREIESASIIANPGCYPTASLVGLYPLAKNDLISGTVVIDAKSGVSGAGRKLSLDTHYPQVSDSICPYSVFFHRHQPEIERQLVSYSSGSAGDVVFVPHLTPMNRGILCTMYVPLKTAMRFDDVFSLYQQNYSNEKFIKLLERGVYPSTKNVQGTNNVHISFEVKNGGNELIVMSAVDNLMKGGAGQAVQNMNLMLGLKEEEGLMFPGLFP
ncbi:MAG: N-acetyl-gamma-glutamyl-phosphate reductase [Actinomycetota bacterium]|nr:N-acetyl-gamma-glutamyl-phosphate reductase [Actinomycetota bacterium]